MKTYLRILLLFFFFTNWGLFDKITANSLPDSLIHPQLLGINYNSPKTSVLRKYYNNQISKHQTEGNKNKLALALIFQAENYRYEWKHDSSKIFLKKSKSYIEQENKTDLQSFYYHRAKASSLFFFDEYEEINNHLDSALSISKKIKIDSLILGHTYYTKYLYFRRFDLYDSALKYIEIAINNYPKKLYCKKLNENLKYIDRLYVACGRVKEAETILYKSLLISQNPKQKSQALFYLGKHYLSRSDNISSLNYFKLRLLNDSVHNINDLEGLARTYNRIAENYIDLKQIDKAINYYRKSTILLGDNLPGLLVETYNILGKELMRLDSIDEARTYLTKAVNLSKSLDEFNHAYVKSFALIHLGKLEATHLNDSLGIERIQKGIKIIIDNWGNKQYILRKPYRDIADASFLFENNEKALQYILKAHQINTKEKIQYSISDTIAVDDFISHFNAVYDLSFHMRILYKMIKNETDSSKIGILHKAYFNTISTYNGCRELVRKRINTSEGKLLKSLSNKELEKNVIDGLMLLFNNTSDPQYIHYLFEYISKNKAATLSELFNTSQVKEYLLPDSLIKIDSELKSNIGYLKEEIHNELNNKKTDTKLLSNLEAKLLEQKIQYDIFINKLTNEYPDFHKTIINEKAITINDIQSSLSKDEALIEISVHRNNRISVFCFTQDDFKFNYLNDSTIFKKLKLLTDYTNIRDVNSLSNQKFSQFKSASSYIYKKLLEPIENQISKKKLIVNPDGKFWYLPFEILLTDSATNIRNFRNLPYLIKDHPISYAYSTKLYFDNDENRSPNPRSVLSIVPSYDASINYIDELLEENTKRDQLSPLPNSIKEAEFVQQTLGGELLKAEGASEKNFKKLADKYKILHLAMHAVIDNENPDYSKLIFTYGVDTTEDNYLNTYEIYNNRLNADLAVLSSCNSGSGKMQKGEGIISIARAFLYAGCPSLVTTLWSVDDASSAKLMQYFYENLKEGMSKSEALQQAKLKFIETASPLQQHPYFWASYTQIGNDDSIDFKRKTSACIWITIVVIFLISSYFLLRKQKAKQA